MSACQSQGGETRQRQHTNLECGALQTRVVRACERKRNKRKVVKGRATKKRKKPVNRLVHNCEGEKHASYSGLDCTMSNRAPKVSRITVKEPRNRANSNNAPTDTGSKNRLIIK